MKIRDIVAIVAVALAAGGCNQQDDGLQQDERVPILLKTSIEGTATGLTRTAGDWGERTSTTLTQGKEFLNGEHVFAYIKENDGTHTSNIKWPIEYVVVNDGDDDPDDGDLDPVSDTTPFFFPIGVTTINIHAIHPSYTTGTGFTVNTDQTTEANYAQSDLCYSMPTDYTRTGNGTDIDENGRRKLQFKHLLSKIVVNLTVNASAATDAPSYISLHAKTTTAMTYPIYSDDAVASADDIAKGYTGCTPTDASNPGIIKMIQEAIIPPQTIAAEASFISMNVPGIGPMIYPMPAATTFNSGMKYTYDIKVTDTGITADTRITPWDAPASSDIVLGKLDWEIRKNPLWYVAEYNIKNAAGTEMASTENDGYFFTWTDAMNLFTGGTTSISEYTRGNNTIANTPSGSTWHMPVRGEWWSIVPSGLTNLASIKSYNGLTTISNAPVIFGYNNTTKGGIIETSWWTTLSQTETRAIRFLGTEFCSAWKYVWANNILTISATLIEPIEKNATAASTWYNSHNWNGTGENAIFWGNDDEKLAVQRSFYSRGHGVDASGPTGSVQVNLHVLHWSATEISDDYSTDNDAWRLQCVVNNYYSVSYGGGANGKNHLSFCIRLFRDN